MIKLPRTPLEAKFLGDLDKSYNETLKTLDNESSTATTDSLSDFLPKTQFFYKFMHGDWAPSSLTVAYDQIILKDEYRHSIPLCDVLGATVKHTAIKFLGTGSETPYYRLRLHFLVRQRKLFSKSRSFCREYSRLDYYTEDENTALKWKNLILHAANNPEFSNLSKIYNIEDLPVFKKLLLVFVNPRSGNNKGEAIWGQAKKLLRKAGCTFIEVFTQHSGYAKEYIKNYNPSQLIKIDGFMSCSGDGVLHEIINGLFQRPDWKEFSHIPFGIVPCGTSNALIKNLLYKKKDSVSLETACHLIAKGRTLKTDLTVLERDDGSKIFSFLLLAWATMAEIDVGSNELRPLGKLRFTVYGLWNILMLKKYQAKISYTTETTELPSINEEITGEGWQQFESVFTHFSIHNLPWIGSKHQAVPVADFQDGVNHLLALKDGSISRRKLTKTLSKMDGRLFKGDQPNPKLGLMYEKIKAFRIEPFGENRAYYAIDGEAYEVTKIQGRVLEKTLTLFGN